MEEIGAKVREFEGLRDEVLRLVEEVAENGQEVVVKLVNDENLGVCLAEANSVNAEIKRCLEDASALFREIKVLCGGSFKGVGQCMAFRLGVARAQIAVALHR